MATVQRLTEQFEFTGTVGEGDKSNVIEGVPLCGARSRHRRRYLKEAFAGEKVKLYNDRPVFLNHVRGTDPRIYEDAIGVVKNARHHPTTGLPVGDIHVNPEKPYARAVLWDAKNNPKACSMSHVADCANHRAADGWVEVTELVYVESVDLVTIGATTSSLREGANRVMSKTYTIKSLYEWVLRSPKAKTPAIDGMRRLSEDAAMGDLAVMDAPPEDGAEPMDKIWEALKSVIADKIEECKESGDNVADCVKEIKGLITGYHGMAGKKEKKEEPTGAKAPEEVEKEAKEAALRSSTALSESLAVCKAAGYRPDPDEIEDLAALPKDRRKGHVERLKKMSEGTGREPPRSTPRNPGSGTPAADAGKNGEPPTGDVKKFKEWVTSE